MAHTVVKVGAGIHVGRDLGRSSRGMKARGASRLPEEVIGELDFEPIKPRGGPVSSLVRVARDERDNSTLFIQTDNNRYVDEPGDGTVGDIYKESLLR